MPRTRANTLLHRYMPGTGLEPVRDCSQGILRDNRINDDRQQRLTIPLLTPLSCSQWATMSGDNSHVIPTPIPTAGETRS